MTELNTQRGWEDRMEEKFSDIPLHMMPGGQEMYGAIKDFIATELTKAREESHNTEDGYCCACDYDIAVMNEEIQSYRQELRKKVKGKSKSCTDECMSQFYDHDCCNCGAREYNQCKDDLLTIISE